MLKTNMDTEPAEVVLSMVASKQCDFEELHTAATFLSGVFLSPAEFPLPPGEGEGRDAIRVVVWTYVCPYVYGTHLQLASSSVNCS